MSTRLTLNLHLKPRLQLIPSVKRRRISFYLFCSMKYDDIEANEPKCGTWIGFDLDHTLMQYKLTALMPMIDSGFRSFLLEELPGSQRIPTNLFGSMSFCEIPVDLGFFRRGTIFDFATGDLLFLSPEGEITTAYHGRVCLSDSRLRKQSEKKCWNKFDTLREGKEMDESFFLFSDFFTLGTVFGCILLVELIDAKVLKELDRYHAIHCLMIKFFKASFDWTNFANASGCFFSAIRRDPSRYINFRKSVIPMIENMRKRGYKTFLCSNSHFDFIHFLLAELLKRTVATIVTDNAWLLLFDRTYAFAQKPEFFYSERKAFPLDIMRFQEEGQSYLSEALATPLADQQYLDYRVFIGGSSREIESLASTKPIYIGDHLTGDFDACTAIGWKGIAVLEDDQPCNADLGSYFPSLTQDGGYWAHRIAQSASYIVSDVLHTASFI